MFGITPWICVVVIFAFKSSEASIPIQLPSLPPENVSCDGVYPTIFVARSFLINAGIEVTDSVELVNDIDQQNVSSDCVATNSTDGFSFNLTSTYAQCAASVQNTGVNEQKVTYYIRANPQPQSVISRFPCVFIRVCCVYNTKLSGMANPIQPKTKTHDRIVNPVTSDFNLKMYVFPNNSYITPINAFPYPVEVNHYAYFGVQIEPSQNDRFILQAHTCWATETSDPHSGPKYIFIIGGCSTDPGNVLVTENYVNERVRFQIKAFYWLGMPLPGQTIHVHCQITACDVRNEPDCLSHNCGNVGRKKRGIPAIAEEGKTVTVGPIKIQDAEKAPSKVNLKKTFRVKFRPKEADSVVCDKNEMGCSHDCGITGSNKAVCYCPQNFLLGEDGKACQPAAQPLPLHKAKIMTHHFLYIGMIVAVSCIVILMIRIQGLI